MCSVHINQLKSDWLSGMFVVRMLSCGNNTAKATNTAVTAQSGPQPQLLTGRLLTQQCGTGEDQLLMQNSNNDTKTM